VTSEGKKKNVSIVYEGTILRRWRKQNTTLTFAARPYSKTSASQPKNSGNTTAHKLEGWVLCKPLIHSQKERKRIRNKEGEKRAAGILKEQNNFILPRQHYLQLIQELLFTFQLICITACFFHNFHCLWP